MAYTFRGWTLLHSTNLQFYVEIIIPFFLSFQSRCSIGNHHHLHLEPINAILLFYLNLGKILSGAANWVLEWLSEYSEWLSKFQYFLKACVTKLSSNYSCHMLISERWAHFFQQMSLKGNEIFCNNIYTYRYMYI